MTVVAVIRDDKGEIVQENLNWLPLQGSPPTGPFLNPGCTLIVDPLSDEQAERLTSDDLKMTFFHDDGTTRVWDPGTFEIENPINAGDTRVTVYFTPPIDLGRVGDVRKENHAEE